MVLRFPPHREESSVPRYYFGFDAKTGVLRVDPELFPNHGLEETVQPTKENPIDVELILNNQKNYFNGVKEIRYGPIYHGFSKSG